MKIRILFYISLLLNLSTAQLTWDNCGDLQSSDFTVEKVMDTQNYSGLGNPMKLKIDELGRMFVSDYRSGTIYMVDPSDNYRTDEIGKVPMVTDIWHGLNGLALPPDFLTSKHIYTVTSQGDMGEGRPGSPDKFRLSRFTLEGNQLNIGGEKIIIEWGIDTRDAHHGGDMDFDAAGNVYIGTGNDAYAHWQYLPNKGDYSYPRNTQTPIDERNILLNALKSSGNTNDLRGKILRIKPIDVSANHPQEDWGPGKTYNIPEGNMFPQGMAKTRPEVFVMGLRNPYGIHVEPNGKLYIADVGPENAPPDGGDQLYIADKPQNFGHPMFVNGNPYEIYDFVNDAGLGYFDAEFPVNYSKFNTGLDTLPPVTEPVAYNSHNQSINDQNGWGFKNGRMALFSGPLYWYNGNNPSSVKFPPHFNGKWLFFNFEQNTIKAATLSKDSVIDITGIFEGLGIERPIDMEFGPDGNLYVLTYSGGGLLRIDYNGSCLPDLPVGIYSSQHKYSPQKLRKYIPGNTRFVRVPEQAIGVELLSLQGKILWSRKVIPGQREIEIPQGIRQGMGLVRITEKGD